MKATSLFLPLFYYETNNNLPLFYTLLSVLTQKIYAIGH